MPLFGKEEEPLPNALQAQQQDSLRRFLGDINAEVRQEGLPYYPGQVVAPFNAIQNDAFARTIQRSQEGSAPGNAAQGFISQFLQQGGPGTPALADTASGANLHGNPYLDAAYNQGARQVTDTFNNQLLPGINSSFGNSGRAGGGLHHLSVAEASGDVTDSLSDLATNIYGGNYQQERARQLNAANALNQQGLAAAGQAPGLAALDYRDIATHLGVGDQIQQQQQVQNQEAQQAFNFRRDEPYNRLSRYAGLLGAAQGGGGFQQVGGQGRSPSALQGAAGGALAGASLGAPAGPVGAIAGGIIGGAAGYFS